MGDTERRQKRRQRGATMARSMIIEATASVFAQKGYHGTTMDDIADASGYSAAAIYKYFRNKEDLFRELWAEMAERLQAIVEESTNLPLPFALRLRWLVAQLGLLLERSPSFVVAFISQRPCAADDDLSPLERQALDHHRRHQRQVAKLVKQGVADGVLRPGNVDDYARMLLALLYEFAHSWVSRGGRIDVSHSIDGLIDMFLRGAGRKELGEHPAQQAHV